ncbi:hypothetical protein [Streptomyces sp. A0958]|uniref:CurL C-terminal domain-containing protein n=1 Tax=Streptomyces sp. A0958 TaxID=2563101 RepID=UPI0014467CCE
MPLLLSARTPAALRAQARRLHDMLRERPELDPADVAATLAPHRAHLEERARGRGPGPEVAACWTRRRSPTWRASALCPRRCAA